MMCACNTAKALGRRAAGRARSLRLRATNRAQSRRAESSARCASTSPCQRSRLGARTQGKGSVRVGVQSLNTSVQRMLRNHLALPAFQAGRQHLRSEYIKG